jgi:hypothetical protein
MPLPTTSCPLLTKWSAFMGLMGDTETSSV